MAEPPRDPHQDKLKDLREKVDLAQQVGERLRAYRAAVYAQRQVEAGLLTRRIEEILLQCNLDPREYTIVRSGAEFRTARIINGRRPPGDIRPLPAEDVARGPAPDPAPPSER